MRAQQASIDNVSGTGMATVGESRGLKKCTGVMIADDIGGAMSLMGSRNSKFSGFVYDDGKETYLTFPIVITRISDEKIEFSATDDPYGAGK